VITVRASPATRSYRSWIVKHIVRLNEGHDPLGHLFALETLARAARSEIAEADRMRRERG